MGNQRYSRFGNLRHAGLAGFCRPHLSLLLLGGLLCMLSAPCLIGLGLHCVPLPPALTASPAAEQEFYDRNGRPLRIVRPDESPFAQPLPYAAIPRPLIEATLAAEDRRFWHHPGVDVRSSLRALWQWTRHRRIVSGGSTIAQQLIKLAEPRPRTLRTKCLEAVQALRLEQVWDRQRILAEYLNRLDYGNFNRGPAAAARFYFAKPLPDLSPAECALLAALPQAPSRLNPELHPDRARKRQQWILGQMQASGWLTPSELERAVAEPLSLAKPRRVFEAPHFVDLLIASRVPPRDDAGPKLRSRGLAPRSSITASAGAGLRTSLDLELNRVVETTLRGQLAELRAQHVTDGAAVILRNETGEVLALVGSPNYYSATAGQINGAWTPRSPGSALKPFTYLLAFEHGATPASIVADVPTEFATATGLFAPVNYNRHCYGPVRYRVALANSLNVSAVKVLASIGGPGALEQRLQQCGISTLDQPPETYGLGLTLGNPGVRLLELANAYACLARLGEYRPYRLLASPQLKPNVASRLPSPPLPMEARVAAGQERRRSAVAETMPQTPSVQPAHAPTAPDTIRVADAGAAFLIADILSDNEARALAFGAESSLRFDFPVACKTGTSSDYRDNWAFGYTPEFTVGIWMGNADNSPMRGVSGVSGAAPILHELFEYLHQRYGTSWYAAPANLVECQIHPLTGKRLRQPVPIWAGESVAEKFLASSLPDLEQEEDYEANPAGAKAVRLGVEYRDWLATGDNWLGDRAVLVEAAGALRILFPPPGTKLFLDPDLPEQGRRLPLHATGDRQLTWQSESLALTREGDQEFAWLRTGRHELSVREAASGAIARTWIDVRAR